MLLVLEVLFFVGELHAEWILALKSASLWKMTFLLIMEISGGYWTRIILTLGVLDENNLNF